MYPHSWIDPTLNTPKCTASSIQNLPEMVSDENCGVIITLEAERTYGNNRNIYVPRVNEEKPAGSYEVNFDAAHLSSGVYFYRIAIHSNKLQTGSFVDTKKMILIK